MAALAGLLNMTDLEYEFRKTAYQGHAIEIAREALDAGYRYLVAAGGDGTINEVVNGMMTPDGPRNPDAVIGVIPGGSGSDFIRTFGLPSKQVDAIAHLSGDRVFPIDVGLVTFTTSQGQGRRYFCNVAEAGLGAEVVKTARKLPHAFGRTRYLLGFWASLMRFKAVDGSVQMDTKTYEGRITNLVVANAQFFGGGMKIAPKAHPADGRFDVLVQIGTKRDYITAITKVYKGEHVPSRVIKEYLSEGVSVASVPELRVEANGESLGVTPASFAIIKQGVRLKI